MQKKISSARDNFARNEDEGWGKVAFTV